MGNAKWDASIASRRGFIEMAKRADGTTIAEVNSAKLWPTMSGYLRPERNIP
jgi:hypothetical protein